MQPFKTQVRAGWHRERITRLGFAGGILALSLVGCSKEPKEKEPVVTVQVASVEKTGIQENVTAEAILFPIQQAAITPKISAPVKTLPVKRGEKVHEGQLLAVLENRDLTAAAEDSKGGYEQAQAAYETTTGANLPEEIQKAHLDTEAARKLMDAQEKVFQSRQQLFEEGALPRKELDQSGVDLTQARNQYEIARKHEDALMAIGKQQELRSAAGQLQSAKGKYMGAQAQLSYSEIRSPIAGVVTDRPLYPGEMAAAGTPLITVMDVSKVIARAHIPQNDAALLKVGDPARITAPGLDDPVEGKITVVSPALDPNSTTVEIWVEAVNPKQRLRPGSTVQVSMLAKSVDEALVVPASALLTGPDGATTVMVAESDGRAHQKAVKVGIRQGDDVQLLEGVQAGDKVLTTGAYGLPDNTKIRVETAPGSESGTPGADKPGSNKPNAGKSDDEKK
jgi:multidrug efflux pump subunit AcrA (membrane-fusion protein)